jgi:hypothetical protein
MKIILCTKNRSLRTSPRHGGRECVFLIVPDPLHRKSYRGLGRKIKYQSSQEHYENFLTAFLQSQKTTFSKREFSRKEYQ